MKAAACPESLNGSAGELMSQAALGRSSADCAALHICNLHAHTHPMQLFRGAAVLVWQCFCGWT